MHFHSTFAIATRSLAQAGLIQNLKTSSLFCWLTATNLPCNSCGVETRHASLNMKMTSPNLLSRRAIVSWIMDNIRSLSKPPTLQRSPFTRLFFVGIVYRAVSSSTTVKTTDLRGRGRPGRVWSIGIEGSTWPRQMGGSTRIVLRNMARWSLCAVEQG